MNPMSAGRGYLVPSAHFWLVSRLWCALCLGNGLCTFEANRLATHRRRQPRVKSLFGSIPAPPGFAGGALPSRQHKSSVVFLMVWPIRDLAELVRAKKATSVPGKNGPSVGEVFCRRCREASPRGRRRRGANAYDGPPGLEGQVGAGANAERAGQGGARPPGHVRGGSHRIRSKRVRSENFSGTMDEPLPRRAFEELDGREGEPRGNWRATSWVTCSKEPVGRLFLDGVLGGASSPVLPGPCGARLKA